jgi:hypothetical protein
MKSPGNQDTQEVRKSQESPQESEKTARSQETEPQESGRLADYKSLTQHVKLASASDDSSSAQLLPWPKP